MESLREDQLGRALTWSVFVHGAILLFLILKSLVFPSDPIPITPSLRVDMVGLPDLLKKDLANVVKTPPKSDLMEKIAEAEKKIKKAEIAQREEVAKPDDMVLKPKKVVEKPSVQEEKEKSATQTKKVQSALARIRALEKLKDRDDEDEAIVIKGNQVSQGTSLSGDAREKAQAGYYDLIRESLVEYWKLPPWLARQKLSAQVIIRIDPAGNVLSSKFSKPSGNAQFDEAIQSTIREAQPLPRPPKELQDTLSNNGVIVGFPL